MFRTVLEMQPRDAAQGGGGVGMTKEDKVKAMLDDILEKLPDEFNMAEIMSKVNMCDKKENKADRHMSRARDTTSH